MNKGRFFTFIATLLVIGGIFSVSSASVFASTKNNHSNNKNNKTFCELHPDNQKCNPPISCPEFGLFPGIIATVTSAGSFLVLKKKKN